MREDEACWWLYLIRMANGNLYCGVTTDLARRFEEHSQNPTKAAKALRGKGPLELVFTYKAQSKQHAMQLEWKIKKCSKAYKEALVAGVSLLE
ncbi:MAG TPA: GIY-YIG nuclease family protein [Pseudomonadales bacterium]|nr:GIY-YIG nuclease family protein [Pseudomonadales bacterium]